MADRHASGLILLALAMVTQGCREAPPLATAGMAQASASAALAPLPRSSASWQQDLPPNARPGACYAKVIRRPRCEIRQEKRLLSAASVREVRIPAQYETVTQRVKVAPARRQTIPVPARYKRVTGRVMVAPAASRRVVIPAQYKLVKERVKISDACLRWQRNARPLAKLGQSETYVDTGQSACLVRQGAKYQIRTRKVLLSPERVGQMPVAAKYATVTREVMVQPASTREVVIPARYKTVQKRVTIRPAQIKRVATPARYCITRKKVQTQPAKALWAEVVCEGALTPDFLRRIQQSLRDQGYYSGPVDGVFGPSTRAALRAFQRASGMVDNYLTTDAARRLGALN